MPTLETLLAGYDKLLIAFSGGVDSTCLLAAAVAALGTERVAALTALSPTLPRHEQEACVQLAAQLGVTLHLLPSREMNNERFAQNGPDRCFHCKSALFDLCDAFIAAQPDPSRWRVAYGANRDDLGDHRPGMEAARLRGIHAPLLEAGMGKAEIRALSRHLNLPTADKPAFACLSSRFPTFTRITEARVGQVEAAEAVLRRLGFRQYRVRYHGETARVEVGREELTRLEEHDVQEEIRRGVQAAGFREVTFDPDGYGCGGANRGHDLT